MTATRTGTETTPEHPAHAEQHPAGADRADLAPGGHTAEELKALAEQAGRDLEEASPLEILRWAAETFGKRFCVTSSMEDAVVAHLASRAMPGVDVVFLDTGYHFPETIGTRDAVAEVMDVNVITLTPRQTVAEQDAEYGPELHDRDPDLCCALRKVKPLEQGLSSYAAWATGLRRDESPTRANTPVVGWDEKRQKVKVSPIARWTQDDVDAYVAEHGVITNLLLMDGYPSIGCAPCTRRVAEGEDARAGRWAGRNKTECGLHG
ncbi:phosphoadenylyl-sulfate reductase [Streptomyces sp. NPDC056132]|uniref:phosphoadenylyl-sulfate reductase n=1 Tax=Streptomyces sp. NPDC056132 TaxID=3345722 RepID=UPI0035DEA022